MVRMRRLMLGLSQSKLADALGITFQQVQKYEKGTNRISASRLQQIAVLLQVPVAFFFADASQPIKAARRTARHAISPDVTAFLTTREGIRFVKAYMQIKRQYLRGAITRLIENIPRKSSS
ncbi:MAG TPA: helix-turn-helix transcriptional regulator [Candidatus Binataceae bacterium]|nr:helix-turn-helix transcriptional regulator [Candidatus Binataceae bacterium]